MSITGPIKSKVDAFWSGGISNPMEVIEQMTYLLFIKRLDEIERLQGEKAARTKAPNEDPILIKSQQKLRWSVIKELRDPVTLYKVVSDEVFPFIKNIGCDQSTYAAHMTDARFTGPTLLLVTTVCISFLVRFRTRPIVVLAHPSST